MSSILEQSKRLCDAQHSDSEAAQGLSRKMEQSAGGSTHDESMFHIAERIPEGTKRQRGVSVEKVDFRRGIDNGLGTASRGSDRDVAISDDHELRHDDDRVHKWQIELEHHPARNIPRSRGCSCVNSHRASTRDVIKVSREVTETVPLICALQAPLETVLMRSLLPRANKNPLIGKT